MVAFGSILTIFAGVIIIAAAIVILVVIAKVKRALDPIATLVNTCDFEQPKLEGRQILMFMSPKVGK